MAHHLDLLRDPVTARAKYGGTRQYRDLALLRRWDLAGRDPEATGLRDPWEAASIVVEALAGVEHASA